MSLDGASARARRLYKGAGFRKAYIAGAAAAVNGRPLDACPYREEQAKTWRSAYRRAWLRGYQSVVPQDEHVG